MQVLTVENPKEAFLVASLIDAYACRLIRSGVPTREGRNLAWKCRIDILNVRDLCLEFKSLDDLRWSLRTNFFWKCADFHRGSL